MRVCALLAMLLLAAAGVAEGAGAVRVGSKAFTESYLLAEIAAQVVEAAGEARAERQLGLGGTGITWRALETGAIDVYPEYAGTLSVVLLKDPSLTTSAALQARLATQGLVASAPIGFNNTYALAVRGEAAERLGLRTISDLARHPELKGAFSSGFLEREDGWPGLRRHYGLSLADARVMEHVLTYRALVNGEVDVIDIYSTDGQIERLRLRILEDDRHFFPDYSAMLLARRELVERYPRTWARLREALEGRIDDRRMAALNARVDLDGAPIPAVAAEFLRGGTATAGGTAGTAAAARQAILAEVRALTLEHLLLVGVAIAAAIALGVPMGIAATRFRRAGQVELAAVGMLQTVPALALLVFMLPLLGIGTRPALVALSLYALLPIARNTYAGMIAVDRQLLEIAVVLGLGRWRRLLRIELPLAAIGIMAGIKTAAVTTVGTATLAAFIGGGGYGTLIVRGLAMDDVRTILWGAAPAAAMAAAFHLGFELLDRLVIPRGLRREAARVV
jgi:osmoprotectant transport system permease protein